MERYHSVEHLDFYIKNFLIKEGAIQVVKKVKPHWDEAKIKIKVFTNGITNRLVGVYLQDSEEDLVLIRVYGEKTELFIDRNLEVRNMKTMHKAGLTPPVYCTFENGLCYGYAPGEVLDEKMVRDPTISRCVSDVLAKMHTIRPMVKIRSQEKFERPEPSLFRGLKKFINLMPIAFNDVQQNERFKTYVPKKESLIAEVETLKTHLKQLSSPVVFCHNDLLLKNIIYNTEKKNVTFIDFEYADYNYQAFDIGNHFCEFAGVDTYNPSLYPSKDFQMRWLKNYLEAWHRLTNQNDNIDKVTLGNQVETLYIQVNSFALAAHLYWGFWALVQAAHSSINFDFLGYAIQRLNEYYAWKEKILKKGLKNGTIHSPSQIQSKKLI